MLKAIFSYISNESKIIQTIDKVLTYRDIYRVSFEIKIAPSKFYRILDLLLMSLMSLKLYYPLSMISLCLD
jgi:hypothetical protein